MGKKAEPPKKRGQPDRMTAFGTTIFEAMVSRKARGNFRDFVLFVNDTMFDAYGKYPVVREPKAEEKVLPVVLLHKSQLHTVLGEKAAAVFWNKRLRRRTNIGMEVYNHAIR